MSDTKTMEEHVDAHYIKCAYCKKRNAGYKSDPRHPLKCDACHKRLLPEEDIPHAFTMDVQFRRDMEPKDAMASDYDMIITDTTPAQAAWVSRGKFFLMGLFYSNSQPQEYESVDEALFILGNKVKAARENIDGSNLRENLSLDIWEAELKAAKRFKAVFEAGEEN